MGAKRITLSSQASEEYAWQLMLEFTVAGESESDWPIADRVATALQPLGWPEADLRRRRQALANATRNAFERSHSSGSSAQVTVRVLIRTTDGEKQRENRGGGVSDHQQTVKPLELEPFRGQGFFLLQKQVISSEVPVGAAHYLIELFVY